MPPRKAKKGATEKSGRENRQREELSDAVKAEFQPGQGWTQDNYAFLKTQNPECVLDSIYSMFGIPLSYRSDNTKSAIQIFAEFHLSSFQFAQQFADTTKALSVIAILSEYISSVPAFATAKDSFATWLEKATGQIQALDFTPGEQQTVIQYLNKNIRSNSHILHFVLTKEAVEQAEREGIKLFRTVIVSKAQVVDTTNEDEDKKQLEFEQQQRLLEEAMKEKREAEERERQEQLAAAIQEIMQQNFERIQQTLDQRNELLLQQLMALEDSIESAHKKK